MFIVLLNKLRRTKDKIPMVENQIVGTDKRLEIIVIIAEKKRVILSNKEKQIDIGKYTEMF